MNAQCLNTRDEALPCHAFWSRSNTSSERTSRESLEVRRGKGSGRGCDCCSHRQMDLTPLSADLIVDVETLLPALASPSTASDSCLLLQQLDLTGDFDAVLSELAQQQQRSLAVSTSQQPHPGQVNESCCEFVQLETPPTLAKQTATG